ncbi:MAG: hypothetical protein HC824_03035 [Synechococcales cyanobacterium RM1_1_8]|nr:hypothetical protein [Synechococcales cyanobacterium RM1_1_8]
MHCAIHLCQDLGQCPHALQCSLYSLPWPLPMQRVEDGFGGGWVGTLVAQTAEDYVAYLFEGHRDRGETLPPAVIATWAKAERDGKPMDLEAIDDWWYLLLREIVSQGYGGLCWLGDKDDAEEAPEDWHYSAQA